MATKQQKEELVEALKAEKKKFDIHLTGYGGEIAIGSISKAQYAFWNDRGDIDEFANDWDNEMEIPEDMQIFTPGEWHDCDNLVHESGCEFSSASWITVYDGDVEVFSCALDYDDLEKQGVSIDGMANDEYRVEHDSDAKHYFVGQAFEKGTFQTYEIEDYKFDPKKLNFRINDIDGWVLVTGVSYMSEELDDTGGYSTTGKSSAYNVFAVDNE